VSCNRYVETGILPAATFPLSVCLCTSPSLLRGL
jgi:hypothetical protein